MPTIITSTEVFQRALREAAWWCRGGFDERNVARSLRSIEIRPRKILSEFEFPARAGFAGDIVDELISKRAALIARIATAVRPASGGRILAFDLSTNLANGLAHGQTDGFFETDDMPPWDTWIHYLPTHLLSWVPLEMIEVVQEGAIDICPTASYAWAADVDDPAVAELMQHAPGF